jgi:hypothetical protein
MSAELMRFSTRPERADLFQPHLRDFHRVDEQRALEPTPVVPVGSLWDDDDADDASHAHGSALSGQKRPLDDAFDPLDTTNVDDSAFDALLGDLF